MKFNNKPLYPYTYGDLISHDGNRIIDSILKLVDDPKFKNSLNSTFLLMIVIGSYSSAAKAIDLNNGAKLANKVLGSKGGSIAFKEVVQEALKLARTKRSLIVATTLVCGASYIAPPAPTNWALALACGILLAETIK